MDSPTFLGQPRTQHLTLVPAYGTRFRPLWDPQKYSGTKGSKIFQMGITSSDAGANTVLLAKGKVLTEGADMGAAAFVDGGVGSDTISRTSGSFVSDGWQVGDPIQIIGATTLANDFRAILTSVAALTLTFDTGTVQAAEALLTTTKILRPVQMGIISVPLSSGYIAAAASVNGLDTSEMPWINAKPNDYIMVADDDLLLAAAGTLLGAGEQIDIEATGADY